MNNPSPVAIDHFMRNRQLPSPKGVALAIMAICRREDVSMQEIAQLVQSDPALSARLLRLANSASHGGRPVASIPEVIRRLGLLAVRQVAVAFSLVDQYSSGSCAAFDYPRFWSHSLLMAVAVRELGQVARVAAPEELFSCGLLARIGNLALSTIYPVEYAQLLAQPATPAKRAELERQMLQVDHVALTAAILADSGIPYSLAEPVSFHESPQSCGFAEGSRPYQLVHLLYHAMRVADLGVAPDIDRDAIILELMLLGGKIGLNAEAHGALIDQMLACWRDWGEVLKVPVNTLPTFDNMVAMPAPPDGNGFLATSVRVLVVEDDPSSQLLAVRTLASLFGKNVHAASNGQEALALALEVTPQIVVTDWHMPVMDGLEFCRALRATEWGQSIYVIMLTGTDEDQEIIDAFDAGVDDYVTKPLNVRALRARLRAALHYVKLLESWERDRAQLRQFAAELALSNRRLEHLALTDLLTGLPNRRAGMNALAEAWSAANRGGQDVTVMTIDIDRFKSVNDTYGHAIGDSVLIEVAAVIRNTARKEDSICRFGGEEFLIVCRNTDLKSSLQAAERLRVAVKSLNIKTSAGVIQTSVSIGVAIKEPSMTDVDALVKSSDMALYSAKHGGRDRTCVYTGGKVHCVKA